MRTLVEIPEPDLRALDELGKKRSASRSKIIRAAVSEYLERNRTGEDVEAFGLWGACGEDGLQYQRRIRREW